MASKSWDDKDCRTHAKKKLATLTVEEKVSLLTAADFWRTKVIPEKGIPSVKTSDGPNGARGGIFVGGTKAALFPCGISLAATWNAKLVKDVGRQLAAEVRARSAEMLLAPTVCLHRHPLGGRNFESFSEDPLLTGKLAAQFIIGLQEQGVAATIKHFVGNEQETDRMNIDSLIPERALRELYLRPFEIAIREANPWAVMTSYNLVNGVHADMNFRLLKDILRGEWGYDGTVISDWSGINSTIESVQAGCDIEFPFSTKWRLDKLVAALEGGRIDIDDIDRAAENVLTLVNRLKAEDMSQEEPEREDSNEETSSLIRTAGHEGLTLLKNDGNILPICPETTKIAVIGPNANRAVAGGGGSASLNPYYNTIPLNSIRSRAKQVIFAQGCYINKWLPIASKYCTDKIGNPGVDICWYAGDKFLGKPVVFHQRSTTDLSLWDSAPLDQTGPEWSAIATTYLTPTATGKHTISFMSVGPDYLVEMEMKAGEAVELTVEMTNEIRPAWKQEELGAAHRYGGCRIGFKQQDNVDYIQEAVEAARAADVVVLIVGLDAEWESEGYDRQTMDLPLAGSQDSLIEAVVEVNPNTVVVNQSGSPVHMPWADEVPAILQAWYQGQEAGNALADVLFGLQNPSSKLPVTFPRGIEDTPAWHSWPGENRKALYSEGIYVGYKHYDHCCIAPLFPFGHGLSYTTFQYSRPKLSSTVLTANNVMVLTLEVSNVGSRAGAEVVQLYVHDETSRLPRPEKELVAFEKVFLEPGQAKRVAISLNKYAVGYYDEAIPGWIAEQGAFRLLIGSSSADVRHTTTFEVNESLTWIF